MGRTCLAQRRTDGDDATPHAFDTAARRPREVVEEPSDDNTNALGIDVLVEQPDLDGFIADHSVEGSLTGDAASESGSTATRLPINPASELGLVKVLGLMRSRP